MTALDTDAEAGSRSDDSLRNAAPPTNDVDARRARAAVEARLFGQADVVSVGRYRIEGRIGAGGMGVVYRAHDPELARDVAVKLLNPDAARGTEAETAQARLVREARAMARLAHPNVIHVYDVGTVENGVFIAMELVEGDDLASWIDAEPRTWTSILRCCLDAGRGLAAAHSAGVVHRDFKPENVLVGKDGRVRVVDFGLAGGSATAAPSPREPTPMPDSTQPTHTLTLRESSAQEDNTVLSLTRTGAMLGTPKYMAPEQYAGATTSARSDQFSFCVTVFEALYGFPPFVGTTVASYRDSVRHGRIQPPPSGSPVPRWIYDELARGMRVDPASRHPGLDALLDRLSEAITRRRSARRRRIAKWWRASAVMVLVLAAVALGAMLGDDLFSKRTRGSTAAQEAEQAAAITPPPPPGTTRTPPPVPPDRGTLAAEDPSSTDTAHHPGDGSTPTPPQTPGTSSTEAHAPDLTPPATAPKTRRARRAPLRTCYYQQDTWKKLGDKRRGRQTGFVRLDDGACYECWQRARKKQVPNLQDARRCRHHVFCTLSSSSKCEDSH